MLIVRQGNSWIRWRAILNKQTVHTRGRSDSWDWWSCRSRKVLDFLCLLNFSYEDKWWSQWSHNVTTLQSDNCSTSLFSNQLSRNLEQTDRARSKESSDSWERLRRVSGEQNKQRDHKITPRICLAGPPLLRQGAGKQVDITRRIGKELLRQDQWLKLF